jgi:hypothetical protein
MAHKRLFGAGQNHSAKFSWDEGTFWEYRPKSGIGVFV